MPEEKKSRYTQAQNLATQKYIRENLEEIKFRVKKGEKDKYKEAAEKAGLSMAKFFITAANEKMERDGFSAVPEPENTRDLNPLPEVKPQPVPKNTCLPEYLTPDILSHIDTKRYLAKDTAYQIEIGSIIGMEHLADLADYLKQHQEPESNSRKEC